MLMYNEELCVEQEQARDGETNPFEALSAILLGQSEINVKAQLETGPLNANHLRQPLTPVNPFATMHQAFRAHMLKHRRRSQMKTLLVVRHAKSSWNNTNQSDHDRPLNSRGKNDAPRMGKELLHNDLVPDLILCSSAERALSTAESVALACNYEREIVVTRRLYLASPDTYLEMLADRGDQFEAQVAMVVGHNPGVEELVEQLTGSAESMTTANIAVITLPIDSWAALSPASEGKLEALWRPKEIG